MVKKIKFKIDANGEVSLEVAGAQGNECEAMSKPFEEKLGIVSSRELKDSYYQNANEESVVTQGDDGGN